MNKITKLIGNLREAGSNILLVCLRTIHYKIRGRNIIPHQNTIIKGVKNIYTNNNILYIGLNNYGFIHKRDRAFLNIQGKLSLNGNFWIGRGCRLDIGKNATVELGRYSFINPFTDLIIMHSLKIGNNCSISWHCQFLDEDFHQIRYERKPDENGNKGIEIGDNVWIGSYVYIYKGVKIPNGCIIASNSVVKDSFDEENALIAGNPAKIVKRNVSWGEDG